MPQTAPALWMMFLMFVFIFILFLMAIIFSSKNKLMMKSNNIKYLYKTNKWLW